MSHELVPLPNGKYSVKPLASPEAMHSSIGAWEEAELLYVGQARLAQKIREPGGELVIFDVGMGIAANALSAIQCFLESSPERDLRIVSFEKHIDALEMALDHADRFPWIARHRAAVADLLGRGAWSFRVGVFEVRWELRQGDFVEMDLSQSPSPDVVFFDFYSPKATPELWQARCFEKIREHASPEAQLYTYCSSTAARSAMLLAGFYVGLGQVTPVKSETTVAAARFEDLERPLQRPWLDKLERSDRPLPSDWGADLREAGLALVRANPQFAPRPEARA